MRVYRSTHYDIRVHSPPHECSELQDVSGGNLDSRPGKGICTALQPAQEEQHMRITFNGAPRLCAYSECDVWFKPNHPSQKYHEVNCKNIVHNDNNRTKYNTNNPIESRICFLDECGLRFLPDRRDQRFCHVKCRSRHHHNNQNLRRRQNRENIAAGLPNRKRKHYGGHDPYHRTKTEYMRYDGPERKMKLVKIPTTLQDGQRQPEGLSWEETLDLMFPYTDAELRDIEAADHA